MKRALLFTLVNAAALAAVAGEALSWDADKHSVTLTASSTDCGIDVQLEFLLVGPGSDRDYEAMFVTDASVKEIAAAFEKAGIPAGVPYDASKCVLWPAGVSLTVEPDFKSLVKETRGEAVPAIVHTGGARLPDGVPEAHTNLPPAVFALYNCGQSLLQLDDCLEQSVAYGRFQPAVKIPKGEKRTFTFRWSGTNDFASVAVDLEPGRMQEALAALRAASSQRPVSALCTFSPELTLKEANEFASMLEMVDSARVKINGFAPNQFFYRAYLPLEKWRDRRERLAQPPEVHFLAEGSIRVVEIKEDWSDEESLDPKLTPIERVFADVGEAAAHASSLAVKTGAMLLFAPADTKLARLFEFRKSTTGDIVNWYVFSE